MDEIKKIHNYVHNVGNKIIRGVKEHLGTALALTAIGGMVLGGIITDEVGNYQNNDKFPQKSSNKSSQKQEKMNSSYILDLDICINEELIKAVDKLDASNISYNESGIGNNDDKYIIKNNILIKESDLFILEALNNTSKAYKNSNNESGVGNLNKISDGANGTGYNIMPNDKDFNKSGGDINKTNNNNLDLETINKSCKNDGGHLYFNGTFYICEVPFQNKFQCGCGHFSPSSNEISPTSPPPSTPSTPPTFGGGPASGCTNGSCSV